MIDENLVVRVNSCIALKYFIDLDCVKDIVRPGLSGILSIYSKLIMEVDNEYLVRALKAIV